MSQTDVITMARFLVLPGATELLEAFSRIPPGKLRDTAIMHVQAIAESFEDAPADRQMPDPLMMAAQEYRPQISPVAALTGPRRGTPHTDDPDVKAVGLMLEGHPPHQVAEELGIPVAQVIAAKKKAKQAGLEFPVAPKGMLPNGKRKVKFQARFALRMEDFDPRGLGIAAKAAERRGLELEAYVDRRRMAVEMAQAGEGAEAIMRATGETEASIRAWLNSARGGGHNVPYLAMTSIPAQFEPLEPEAPTADVIDFKPHRNPADPHKGAFITHESEMNPSAKGSILKGAEAMGLTIPQYLTCRREALILFASQKSITEVARLLNISRKQAENWRGRAQRAGKLNLTEVGAERRALKASRTQGSSSVASAAAAMGMTPATYKLKRAEAIKLMGQGMSSGAVAKHLGLKAKKIANWWTVEQQKRRA